MAMQQPADNTDITDETCPANETENETENETCLADENETDAWYTTDTENENLLEQGPFSPTNEDLDRDLLDTSTLKQKIEEIEDVLAETKIEVDNLYQAFLTHKRQIEILSKGSTSAEKETVRNNNNNNKLDSPASASASASAETVEEPPNISCSSSGLDLDLGLAARSAAPTTIFDDDDDDAVQNVAQVVPFLHPVTILRDAEGINLQVTIQVMGNVPKSTHSFDMSAAHSPTLSALRTNIVSVGSENRALQRMTLWEDAHLDRLIRDLNRVTFKLEEDGHAATMNITPTKVDRHCAFPGTEYEAWFYRNVRRGRKSAYAVQVNIVV